MKILFYINTLKRNGAERVVANLANEFVKINYETVVVTTEKHEDEYILNDGVKRYTLEKKSNKQNKLLKNITRIISLRKVIINETPDVVISFMIEANFRAVLATIGLKTKIIISVRNDPKREYKGILGKIVGRFILPFVDGCVFQTEEAMRWFTKRLQYKSCIILNPVDEVFFKTKYDGLRKDIVTTGRLVKQKNHELLIRAFTSIANRIDDNLIIYGEGQERNSLEKLINQLNMKGRIFLPGNINNVADTIKSAKIYVLSSDFEGMPNGLMEAMALGLPCISTDCPCGGPREIITNGINGLLVSVNNKKKLANAMLELLKDDNKLNIFGIKAREKSLIFKSHTIISEWQNYIHIISLKW